jgi:hypothetical protein
MEECIICFNSMKKKEPLIKCSLCFNYTHAKCYKKWIKKSNISTPIQQHACLYCQRPEGLTKINISLFEKLKKCLC